MKKGWQTKQLGELAELKGRIGWRGLTAREYTKEGPLFLSVHSLNYGDYVDFRDAFHISEERYVESPEIMLQRPCACVALPPKTCEVCGKSPCECPPEPCEVCGQIRCVCEKKKKVKVKLADGKERTIQHMMMTTFWHPDGTPMSAQQFMELLFGKLPEFFQNEEELRKLWSAPDTRSNLLQGLAEKGFGHDQLADMQKIIDALPPIDAKPLR